MQICWLMPSSSRGDAYCSRRILCFGIIGNLPLGAFSRNCNAWARNIKLVGDHRNIITAFSPYGIFIHDFSLESYYRARPRPGLSLRRLISARARLRRRQFTATTVERRGAPKRCHSPSAAIIDGCRNTLMRYRFVGKTRDGRPDIHWVNALEWDGSPVGHLHLVVNKEEVSSPLITRPRDTTGRTMRLSCLLGSSGTRHTRTWSLSEYEGYA